MLINIGRWRIPKKNSKRQRELWREMMDYQGSHPEKVFYVRSHFFTFSQKDSPEENWMFLDEYKNHKDFDKWMKTVHEDPELAKLANEFFPKWNALIIPKSRKTEVWTQVQELTVEPPSKKYLRDFCGTNNSFPQTVLGLLAISSKVRINKPNCKPSARATNSERV